MITFLTTGTNALTSTLFSETSTGEMMMGFCKQTAAAIAVLAVITTPVLGHEMLLEPKEFIVPPNSSSDQIVRLINGTLEKSENSTSRENMADVSIVANGRVTHPPDTAWYDDKNSSYLHYRTGEAGTYIIGLSTRPKIITMPPGSFKAYLEHDGLLDTLAAFEKESTLTEVRERYSKHVRTVVQVGDKKTADYSKQLGYPVEIVLDQNPYDLNFGDELSFRVLFNGKPAVNQLVRANYAGFHSHDTSGGHTNAYDLRTDKDGRARFLLSSKSLWYISLIHMQRINDSEADYESNWATITFQVK